MYSLSLSKRPLTTVSAVRTPELFRPLGVEWLGQKPRPYYRMGLGGPPPVYYNGTLQGPPGSRRGSCSLGSVGLGIANIASRRALLHLRRVMHGIPGITSIDMGQSNGQRVLRVHLQHSVYRPAAQRRLPRRVDGYATQLVFPVSPRPRGRQSRGPVRRPAGGALSGLFDDVIEAALPTYEAQIKKAQPWLRKRGQAIGRQVMSAVKGAVFSPKDEKPSGPAWLPKVINPVLDPFVDGLQGEIVPVVATAAAAGAGTLIGIGFALGWLITRRRR